LHVEPRACAYPDQNVHRDCISDASDADLGRSPTVKILVLNCGSSSLKWALFDGGQRVGSDAVTGIGLAGGRVSHVEAVRAVLHATPDAEAVGPRIVHGGPALQEPATIDSRVLSQLREAVEFAPLHLPTAIQVIEAVAARAPSLPQVGCFDTAFHRTL